MSDKEKLATILPSHTRLNDFSHREESHPAVSEPSDLITKATPAQRERIVYMVDQALDTLDELVLTSKPEVRLKAVENILDRSGMPRITKHEGPIGTPDIPADALVNVIGGLAAMFGVKGPDSMRFAGASGQEEAGLKGGPPGSTRSIGRESGLSSLSSPSGKGKGSEGGVEMPSERAEGVYKGRDAVKRGEGGERKNGLPASYLNRLEGKGGKE